MRQFLRSTIAPGIEERIKQSDKDVVKSNKEQKDHNDTKNDANAKRSSRCWFASTACPLLAGTFGPIASGFNICALAYHWRQHITPGESKSTSEQAVQTMPDPPFLIVLNVASLVCAIVGNASLLLNMTQRVRFPVAQRITIAGFLLAGALLIVDLAVLCVKPDYGNTGPGAISHDRHALTGAFYYGIFAASTYIVIGVMMLATVYSANTGHYRERFDLTGPQRTLMLQTMSFVTYLLLGALVYSRVEGWEYLDAVYWADVTLLTVGLGEYSPSTALGKGLLFPFAIGGILMIGLVVSSIRSLILDRGKENLSLRLVEKKRLKATNNVDERKQTIRISNFAKTAFNTDPSLSQTQRRKEEFTALRRVQAASFRGRRWFDLATSGAFALLLWFVGAAIFQQTESTQQWTYVQSLYFSYTSLLTIGYGDFYPQSDSGKAFYVIWSLLAIPSLTILISNMDDTIFTSFSDITVSITAVSVLPGEQSFHVGITSLANRIFNFTQSRVSDIIIPDLLGDTARQKQDKERLAATDKSMQVKLADRLAVHVLREATPNDNDSLSTNIKFYHYVLARECRAVQRDLSASPGKRYSWEDWEYYLLLIGNEESPIRSLKNQPGTEASPPLGCGSPQELLGDIISRNAESSSAKDGARDDVLSTVSDARFGHASPGGNVSVIDKHTCSNRGRVKQSRDNHHFETQYSYTDDFLSRWSWLSEESPLLNSEREPEWILERLSAALERELERQQYGYQRQPPIDLPNARKNVSGRSDHNAPSARRTKL